MATSLSGGGAGTTVTPSPGAALLPEARFVPITTPPTDTPASGTLRLYVNEAGAPPYRRWYTYSPSGWSYMEG